MSMLTQFTDNFLEHVRNRLSSHVFGRSAEHDISSLNHEIFKHFGIQKRIVLVLFFQVSINLLDCMLNFSHCNEEIKVVVSKKFPDIG
jgi:hypothetical protein